VKRLDKLKLLKDRIEELDFIIKRKVSITGWRPLDIKMLNDSRDLNMELFKRISRKRG